MKFTFVVDINILICGAKRVDEHDKEDDTSYWFLIWLLKNCHIIMVDPSIKKNYRQWLEKLALEGKRGFIDTQILTVLNNIVHNCNKLYEFGNSVTSAIDLDSIPRKDRDLANLAYHMGLPMVTLDEPLRDSINKHPSFMTKQLKALHPLEALKIVKENQ